MDKGYLVVTDYVKANTGEDVSDALQALILANPNRTLFFPDGEYVLGKPILTPANPAHSVMLELSNYAVIKAADGWSSDEAMIRFGAAEPFNSITVNGSNYGITGGIIDGNGKATGVMDPGQANGYDVNKCARKAIRAIARCKHEKVIGGFDTIMVPFYRYITPLFRLIARNVSAR